MDVLHTDGQDMPNSVRLSSGSEAHDAFSVRCDPARSLIHIKGSNPRSVLYGVYGLLRSSGVVAWCAPGKAHEIITRRDSIVVPEGNCHERALLKYRGYYVDTAQHSVSPDNVADVVDWIAKNFGNYLLVSVCHFLRLREPLVKAISQRDLILEVGHHGFHFYVDSRQHFSTNPEWFSLLDGERQPGEFFLNMIHNSQLCTTNRQVVDFYVEAFMRFWEQNPEVQILGIVPNDGFGWCECEACMRLEPRGMVNPLWPDAASDRLRHQGSGRYQHFVREVTQRIEHRITSKRVSFMAYAGMILPTAAVQELPSSVALTIALYERWYDRTLIDSQADGQANSKILDILGQWRKQVTGDINIYEYYAKYCWLSLPKWMPELIRSDTRFFAAEGFQGLMSMIETDNFAVYEPNHLSQMAMSWSATLEPQNWLSQYTEARFGSWAVTARRHISGVAHMMAPFACLGPCYPPELTSNALDSCQRLLEGFSGLAADSAVRAQLDSSSLSRLRVWAANLELAHARFALNRLYHQLRLAVAQNRDELALTILDEWLKIKKRYITKYRDLIGSGAVLSDERWLSGKTGQYYAQEHALRESLQASDRAHDRRRITALTEGLRKFAC